MPRLVDNGFGPLFTDVRWAHIHVRYDLIVLFLASDDGEIETTNASPRDAKLMLQASRFVMWGGGTPFIEIL